MENSAQQKDRRQEKDKKKRILEELKEKREGRKKSDKGIGVCVCVSHLCSSPGELPLLMD